MTRFLGLLHLLIPWRYDQNANLFVPGTIRMVVSSPTDSGRQAVQPMVSLGPECLHGECRVGGTGACDTSLGMDQVPNFSRRK